MRVCFALPGPASWRAAEAPEYGRVDACAQPGLQELRRYEMEVERHPEYPHTTPSLPQLAHRLTQRDLMVPLTRCRPAARRPVGSHQAGFGRAPIAAPRSRSGWPIAFAPKLFIVEWRMLLMSDKQCELQKDPDSNAVNGTGSGFGARRPTARPHPRGTGGVVSRGRTLVFA